MDFVLFSTESNHDKNCLPSESFICGEVTVFPVSLLIMKIFCIFDLYVGEYRYFLFPCNIGHANNFSLAQHNITFLKGWIISFFGYCYFKIWTVSIMWYSRFFPLQFPYWVFSSVFSPHICRDESSSLLK